MDLAAARADYVRDGQWADDDLAALATSPVLGEIAAALLGAESVRLWQDQLLYKPPGGPTETTIGWHQDWASWDTVASHGAFSDAYRYDDLCPEVYPRSFVA